MANNNDVNKETTVEVKPLKKVSLEQLIRKKLEKDGKRTAKKDIYIESLGGLITFTAPTDAARIEYADKTKSENFSDMVPAMEKLIYDCCPMLHSKELLDGIEIEYPYDAVRAIFDIGEITDLGVKLIHFFDDEDEDDESEEEKDKLKN